MNDKSKILIRIALLMLPALLLSQALNWIYTIDGPGAAMQVLYSDGNIYAVGSAPTNTKRVFEKTFFGPPEDERGGVIRETPEQGYVIAGTGYQSGVYLINIDSIGNLIWSKFYDAVAYVISGMELTLDGGYVVVAYLWGGGIWLIKTDSMGDTLWTRTYTDASPGMSSKAIQQTADKGYIITGTTTSNNGDVYLLKTDSLGNVMWTKTYWAPPGQNQQQFGCSVRLTVDGGYIVYAVRKVSSTSFGAWLLKTDSSGDTLWTRTYNISSLLYPTGCAEQTTDGGCIIGGTFESGGCHSFLLKTDAAGDSLWCTILNINNVMQFTDVRQTLDGGYVVTAQNSPYLYLSKRDSQGSEIWTTYYGNGLGAWGTSVCQTLDGGYIAAGTAKTAAAGDTTYDIYVVKTDSLGKPITQDLTITSFNQSGDVQWIYQYDGPGNDEDLGFTLTRGMDGNFYAGGFAEGTDDIYYSTIVSIDSTGDQRWVYSYDSGGISSPIPTIHNVPVIYGSDGNIYASGCCGGPRGIIISLTSAGDLNWCYEKEDALFTTLIYGSDGNLYAIGYKYVSNQADFLILSISAAGIERWSYEQNLGTNDRAISIDYGEDDNLYVCGCTGSPNALDFTVISVDTAGTERWVYRLNEGSDDIAYSVIYGSDGNIYAAGGVGSPYSMDWTIVSLAPFGDTNWVYRYDGPSHTDDWAHSISYGVDGNLYTTGCSDSVLYMPDFTVICIDTQGIGQWVYRGPRGWGWSVVKEDENVYAAGDGWYIATDQGFTVMSTTHPQNIDEEKNIGVATPKLFIEIYPNPFREKVSIVLSAEGKEKTTLGAMPLAPCLKIYDASGRLVRQWDYPTIGQSNQITWQGDDDFGRKLPAGIYFCQLQCKGKKEIKKLVIVQ